MKCPKCMGKLTVTDTTYVNNDIYRRRKCTVCGNILYTIEFVVEYDDMFKKEWNKNHRSNKSKKEN